MPYHSLNKNSINFLHTSLSHYAMKRRYGHLLKKKKEKKRENKRRKKKKKKKKESNKFRWPYSKLSREG
jgi:predicted ribosome quality control (RQC) complex YloA/Tae2 family protein